MYFFDELSRYRERTALLQDDGQSVSYQQLTEHAGWIGERVSARSLIFCLCENRIGSVAGYLALLQCRAVPLLLDARIDCTMLNRLLELYRPAGILLPAQLAKTYCADGADTNRLTGSWSFAGEKWDYAVLQSDQKDPVSLYPDLGLLLTTSGSTGSPRLVRQSYENIEANAKSIVQYLELNEEERPVTTLPMHYTYGLSIINSHILTGACILLTEHPVITKAFWDFMKQNRATSFGGVPYTYEMLKRVRFFRMDLPDLRTMTQAGGKLLPDLHKEFAEYASGHGKRFVVMYGQTEATARMGYLPPDMAPEKVGSTGIAIPGGMFSLIDTDGNVIDAPDVVGELIYEGPNVTLGYAACPEDLAKGDERNGRLETGDMAKRDADGYYYIVGRRKRFLKIFGSRVNLDEIERIIRSKYPDVDCACSGEDDRMQVYISQEDKVSEIGQFICEKTHINQRAVLVRALQEIPRNESGKILYHELPG